MNRTFTNTGLIFAAGLALASCQTGSRTSRQDGAELPPPMGTSVPVRQRPISLTLASVGGPSDGYSAARLLARQRLAAKDNGPDRLGLDIVTNGPRETRPIDLAFRELDAKDALRVIITDLLGRDSIIEPEVTGAVTLNVSGDLSNQDLYDVLDALCTVHGWSLESRGEALVVRSGKYRTGTSVAPILSTRVANPSIQPGVRIFPVRYVKPQEIGEVLKPLLSQGGALVLAGRLVVAADTTAQLNRFGDLLRMLDTPAFDGVEIWTYELANQNAVDAVKVLESIAAQSGLSSGGDALASFIAIPRTARIVVISRDPTLQSMLQEWVTMVDQPSDAPRRQEYVYHIQNMDPAELKTLLEGFYAGQLEVDPKDRNDPRMRLIISREEDLLLIRATPSDYADLISLLERIDIPRQQVHLQAVIAEVTLSDSLEYGIEYFLTSDAGSGILNLSGTVNQFSPANPAGSAVFLATSGFAVIDALKTKSDIAVLSSPNQLVRDKDVAELKVGASVPIVTAAVDSSTQTGGTSGVRNEIEYRDTGVILAVTPKINESGEVTMDIKLEVTDAVPTTSSGIDSPTFTTRISETTVIVPDGMTVLIGGAIENRTTDRNSRIPLLGDIPGLGAVFQSQQKQMTRTELLLAITPTIINEPADATLALSEFVQSSFGVREALRRFVAPIPDVLRLIEAPSTRQDMRLALAEAPAATFDTNPASPETPSPEHPTPTDLRRLAATISLDESDESAAVSHFLRGLAERAPSAGEG